MAYMKTHRAQEFEAIPDSNVDDHLGITFGDVAKFFPYLDQIEEQAVNPEDFCDFQIQLNDPENE